MPTEKYKAPTHNFNRYRTWALYERYLTSLNGRKDNPYAISGKEFSAILKKFHQKIRDKIIYENYVFRAPHGFGKFYIYKYKPKIYYDSQGRINPHKSKMFWNWKKFLALSKKERHDSDKIRACYDYRTHSRGYMFKIHWGKKFGQASIRNLSVYKFKPGRRFKFQAKDAFFNMYPKGEVDYIDKTWKR